MINCLRGYVSLIFVVSLTVLISATTERIMVGSVVVCFFWLLLLVMDQMMQFEVNHWFANFMPLRLSGSADFYTTNEIYRFGESSFDSIVWCPLIALVVSVVMIALTVLWLMKERVTAKASQRQNHI